MTNDNVVRHIVFRGIEAIVTNHADYYVTLHLLVVREGEAGSIKESCGRRHTLHPSCLISRPLFNQMAVYILSLRPIAPRLTLGVLLVAAWQTLQSS